MSSSFVTYSFQNDTYSPQLNVQNTKNTATFNYPCNNTLQCQPYAIKLKSGVYKFEAWGPFSMHDKGSYVSGVIKLSYESSSFLVFVGGKPNECLGGYNGGGDCQRGTAYGGAGATDIRLDQSLNSRIMVAAGSGGDDEDGRGPAGTDVGLRCSSGNCGAGGTQTAGGSGYPAGSFGQGGSSDSVDGGGGGGGYWGGGHGGNVRGGGGGGSSFVSGHPYCNAVVSSVSTAASGTPLHYSGLRFESPVMIGASERIPDPEDSSKLLDFSRNMNGVFRITLIESHTACRAMKTPFNIIVAFAAILNM